MEPSLPEWLDNEFLAKCLQHKERKQTIVVTNFNASLAAPAGNNYGSLVIRVKTDYKDDKNASQIHSTSLIVKTEHIEGAMKGMFESEYKEPIFYNEFVPKVNKFIETNFLPESFYSPIADAMVLEDLKEKGFVMADRKKQLGFDHCCLYLRTAASLHAASVAVYKEDPEFMEVTIGKEKLFEGTGAPFLKSNLNLGITAIIKSIEQNEQLTKCAKILKDAQPSLWDVLVQAHKPSKIVNTFNQGDPWTTNMMFKYNKENVSEIKLIDFQIPRFGSPVNDVIFFLWSSATHDVMENRLDELYDFYLEQFNNKLQELNCSERLSHERFMENVKLLSPLVVFAVTSMIPFVFGGDPTDIADMKEIEKGNENVINPFDKCYTQDYCENHLPRLIHQMEKTGVFDYLEKCN